MDEQTKEIRAHHTTAAFGLQYRSPLSANSRPVNTDDPASTFPLHDSELVGLLLYTEVLTKTKLCG